MDHGVKCGEGLVLLATYKPWNFVRAVEELGDALYIHDTNICIEADEKYPLLYVHSLQLRPEKAFTLVVQEPPAYVERVIPVTLVYKMTILDRQDVELFAGMLAEFVKTRGIHSVNVEVRKRGYYIKVGFDDKPLTSLVSGIIAGSKIRVLHKSTNALRIEDTRYGVVVGLILNGSDRLHYWRLKRLTSSKETY